MQEFVIISSDPLGVLTSTGIVMKTASEVHIRLEAILAAGKQITERMNKGLETLEASFGFTGSLRDDVQLIFFEDAVNFCFWPEPGKKRWEVRWPATAASRGGWYGLKTCFERALGEGIPILDAGFIAELSYEDADRIFGGMEGVQIPLLKERMHNLREAGRVLNEKFEGFFLNMVEAAEWDAIDLVKLIVLLFSSFRDISIWNGTEVRFLKRAQIVANDITYALAPSSKTLKRIGDLTAFADYKLPQLLREMGVLEYSASLSGKVDGGILIVHDSKEEIEIRAATIWAVELLRREIGTLTAGEIDNILWLLSQEMTMARPYHKTRTIFY